MFNYKRRRSDQYSISRSKNAIVIEIENANNWTHLKTVNEESTKSFLISKKN